MTPVLSLLSLILIGSVALGARRRQGRRPSAASAAVLAADVETAPPANAATAAADVVPVVADFSATAGASPFTLAAETRPAAPAEVPPRPAEDPPAASDDAPRPPDAPTTPAEPPPAVAAGAASASQRNSRMARKVALACALGLGALALFRRPRRRPAHGPPQAELTRTGYAERPPATRHL